jgi:protein-disulfide isomerase
VTTNRRPRAERALSFANLTAAGLLLGLVAVVGLILVQRPYAMGSGGAIVVPSGLAALASPSGSPLPAIDASPSPAVPSLRTDARSLGVATARVTVDVWSDYQCPACRAFVTTLLPRLMTDYVQPGLVRVVYHDFAFIGPESVTAAVGARCAAQVGRFEAYHTLVYANQGAENSGALSRPRLVEIAAAAGAGRSAFGACLDDSGLAAAVSAETAAGRALGVTATPSLVIAGQVVRGVPSWENLVALLSAAGATN